MFRIETQTHVNPELWNDDVRKLNGCPFHSYEWSLFSAKANQASPLYLRWLDASGKVQALGFALVREKRVGGLPFFKTLSLGSFPASNGSVHYGQMLNALIDFSRERGCASLNVHSFGTPEGTDILCEMGFEVGRRWEFLVALGQTKEELWKKIHSKKRNLIRKGQKEGLRVSRSTDFEEVMAFRDLALETYNRKTEQGISFPRPAEAAHYQLLKEGLLDPGLGRLYLAYDGAQVVSGAFFVGFNGSAYYMLSSASDQGLRKAAPDLVLWTAMTDYLNEGFSLFNLGGVSENELNGQPLEESGLFHFKRRFSAEVIPCYKGELVLRPKKAKLYSVLKGLKSFLSKKSCQ